MESDSIDHEMYLRKELMRKLEIETDQVIMVSYKRLIKRIT